MNKHILSLSVICLLLACHSSPKKNLSKFKPLIGAWEGNRDGMTLMEIWKEENASSFSGDGIAFVGKDTLFHERLTLEIQDTSVIYTSTTPVTIAKLRFFLNLFYLKKINGHLKIKSVIFPG